LLFGGSVNYIYFLGADRGQRRRFLGVGILDVLKYLIILKFIYDKVSLSYAKVTHLLKNGVKEASFLEPISKNTGKFPSLLIIYSTLAILAILIIASVLEQCFDQIGPLWKFTKKNTSWIKTPITILFFGLLMGVVGMALARLFGMEIYCLMQRTNYSYCQNINLDCTNENGFNITRTDNGITYLIDAEGTFH